MRIVRLYVDRSENGDGISRYGARVHQMGDEAYTDEVRESYLQLAQIWLNAASRLDVLSEALSEAPISAVTDEQKKPG
jgi:hypothetical protein